MSAWDMIKTIFFGGLTFLFFFVIWIYNPFIHRVEYEVPSQMEDIINDSKAALQGRELFKTMCTSCHSVRYDGIYLMSVASKPEFKNVLEKFGTLIRVDEKTKEKVMFLSRDVYEAVAMNDLLMLKSSFGKIPPDLSTIYLSRGAGYLYNFILNPQKVLPGTSMPPVMTGQEENTAKIVSYLRSVSEPSKAEKAKRTVMGIVVIAYFVAMGVLLWIWRKKLLAKMGYGQ